MSEVAALNTRWSEKKEKQKDGIVYTLSIVHSTEDDVGNYSCAAYVDKDEVARAYIYTSCE